MECTLAGSGGGILAVGFVAAFVVGWAGLGLEDEGRWRSVG